MKRKEVTTFIASGITMTMKFGTGRISEFNSARDNDYGKIWLEPLADTATEIKNNVPFDNWKVVLHIALKDKQDSSPGQYEDLIDEADLIGQELIKNYNQIVDGYKLVTLSGISRVPFIKKHADVLTGVILSFTLNAPDTENFC